MSVAAGAEVSAVTVLVSLLCSPGAEACHPSKNYVRHFHSKVSAVVKMGEVAELKELVSALVAETERLSLESARREAERTGELDRLIAALTQRPVVVCCCRRPLPDVENPSSVSRVSTGCVNVGSSGRSSEKRGIPGRCDSPRVGGGVRLLELSSLKQQQLSSNILSGVTIDGGSVSGSRESRKIDDGGLKEGRKIDDDACVGGGVRQRHQQQQQRSARKRRSCYKCGKFGHFQRDCWSGGQRQCGSSITDEQRETSGPECEDFSVKSLEVVAGSGGISVHQAMANLPRIYEYLAPPLWTQQRVQVTPGHR